MSRALRFWLLYGLAVALLLALLSWGLAHWQLRSASTLMAERLVLLNELRRDALQEYFHTAEAELRFWALSPDIISAVDGFSAVWAAVPDADVFAQELRRRYQRFDARTAVAGEELAQEEQPSPALDYGWRHHQTHPLARQFVVGRGYYDFFLIGTDGTIYYTVEKESDFAADLNADPLRDSHLAAVYRRALALGPGEVAVSDLGRYGPSDGDPAIFMALGLRDAGGALLGVVAFQLPTDRIQAIMNYRSGMGRTGETYLVGPDRLMRSNSRFSEEPTVLRRRVDSSVVASALAGEEGYAYLDDYRGVPVLSAYSGFGLDGIHWAMIADIEREEVEAFAAAERPPLAGVLLGIYGLFLWTAWYWRSRQLPGSGSDNAAFDGLPEDEGPAAGFPATALDGSGSRAGD